VGRWERDENIKMKQYRTLVLIAEVLGCEASDILPAEPAI
jgi:hypothetical protein